MPTIYITELFYVLGVPRVCKNNASLKSCIFIKSYFDIFVMYESLQEVMWVFQYQVLHQGVVV